MLFQAFDAVNNSKIAWGLGTIAMQLGARYVVGDLTEMQNKVLGSMVAKRVVMCGMIFVATRDIMISVAMTLAIHVVLGFLFNERSGYCVIPPSVRNAIRQLDADKEVTKEQYEFALAVVQKYRSQGAVPAERRRQRRPPRLPWSAM